MSNLQEGHRADHPQNNGELALRSRSYSMHKVRSDGSGTNWQSMNLNVSHVQSSSQFQGTLQQTVRLTVAIALTVSSHCHACGARLEWRLKVKDGVINETRQ